MGPGGGPPPPGLTQSSPLENYVGNLPLVVMVVPPIFHYFCHMCGNIEQNTLLWKLCSRVHGSSFFANLECHIAQKGNIFLAWNLGSVLHRFVVIYGPHFVVFGTDFFSSCGPCGTPCGPCASWSVLRWVPRGKNTQNGINKWHQAQPCETTAYWVLKP